MISSDEVICYMSKIQGRFEFSPSAESLFKSMLMLSTSMIKLPLRYGYQNILCGPFLGRFNHNAHFTWLKLYEDFVLIFNGF